MDFKANHKDQQENCMNSGTDHGKPSENLPEHHENLAEHIEDVIEEVFFEEELIEDSKHKGLEHVFLWARNAAVLVSFVLFILSFVFHGNIHLLRGIAYIFGACAYFSEIVMATDGFSREVPHREMFMAYCFGPLYIMLAISYLLE